jgi:glutamate-1-semialdehyde 2,1-aminomutase
MPNASEARFRERTPSSLTLADEARQYIPDGITGTSLANAVYPVFIDHAQGQYLYDVDGNRYLDLSNGYSALPLGHMAPSVIEAVAQQMKNGLGLGLMNATQVKLASMITERYASMQKMRFTASGSEATMFAVRAARAFTGKTLFARMEGSYHGMHDMMCSGMGMNVGQTWLNTENDPVNNGVLPSVREGVVYLQFNDIEQNMALLEPRLGDLAAIIVEPVMCYAGCIVPEPGYLNALRAFCDRHGVVLIFDEMVTLGLAGGGGQEYFGVTPDMTTSGKILGGGMPVGIFGGRADIMAQFAGGGGRPMVHHTGTWNAHPLSMAAGIAQLEALGPEQFAYLGEIGDAMRMKVGALAAKMGVPIQVTGVQHISCFNYTDRPIRNRRDALHSDNGLAARVAFSLMSQGFYMLGARTNLSTAITHADIDDYVGALAVAFEECGACR